MSDRDLFGERSKPKPIRTGSEPTECELGEAVQWAVQLAVNKKYLGAFPASMSRTDLAAELIEPTLHRCRQWRSGGKVLLTNYAYVSACNALNDYMRKRARAGHQEVSTKEALLSACADLVLYEDELRLFQMTKVLFKHLRSRNGDVFDKDVVTLEDFEKVF